MNRNQLKEVASSHLNKAGENKKKRDQLYYQQNKEVLKAKRKEHRAQKKTEQKITVTNTNLTEKKPNITVKNVQPNKR